MLYATPNRNVGLYENSAGQVGILIFLSEDDTSLLLTVSEAAQELNVSERSIQMYLDEEKLIGIKVLRDWFVFKSSMQSFAKTLDR